MERLGVIIGISLRIKSRTSMKYELTSTLNILVIDKNMYLFPELFFCDIYIALHAPIKGILPQKNFIAQTSDFG